MPIVIRINWANLNVEGAIRSSEQSGSGQNFVLSDNDGKLALGPNLLHQIGLVDSFSALANVPPSDSLLLFLKDYYDFHDGGQGYFYWDKLSNL